MMTILWLGDCAIRVGESFVDQYEIVHDLGECGSSGNSRDALQNRFDLNAKPF